MKKILIVGSTHGHEKIGQYVTEKLKGILPANSGVEFIVGNPKASDQNIPFIESDLNRIFPGKVDGTYEERRAYKLGPKILEADLVIDIHSTNTTDYSPNSMLIVTKLDDQTKKIIDIINPPKVLVMKYKNDKALISQAKIGIAFEYGKDSSQEVLAATTHDIINLLVSYKIINKNVFNKPNLNIETEIFEVYDAFEKTFEGKLTYESKIENFKLIRIGEIVGTTDSGVRIFAPEDFYPIMFGENRYTTILGFKAIKI